MKTAIEYNEQPVTLQVRLKQGQWYVVPGLPVNVCAWCDPSRILTQALAAAGYKVSHGICGKCKDKAMKGK